MKYFFLIIFLLSFLQIKAQEPDWLWARSGQFISSGGKGEGFSIAMDDEDCLYLTGEFTDTVAFGTFVLQSPHFYCVFLTKYDSSGNVKWAKGATNIGSGGGGAFSVATDKSANVYLTGVFQDTIAFGSDTLRATGLSSMFIVKYDSAGNVIWAHSSQGNINGDANGMAVDVDEDGNIIVAGAFSLSPFSIGGFSLNQGNVFLVKYDSSGNVVWLRGGTGLGGNAATCAITDSLNNIYISGYYADYPISFGSDTLPIHSQIDIFLVKYNSTGDVLWAKSFGGGNDERAISLAIYENESVYLSGYFNSNVLYFDSISLGRLGNNCTFITKLDSSGNAIWAKCLSTFGQHHPMVATDRSGNVFLTGGISYPTIVIDTLILQQPPGSSDAAFIAKFNSSGNLLFAKAMQSGGDDNLPLLVAPSGSIYIGGDFMVVNPFILGTDSLPLTGSSENIFAAKLGFKPTDEVSQLNGISNFALFPNPCGAELNIKLEEKQLAEIIIYDVAGRKLVRQKFTSTTTLNTGDLANGIYIYEVRTKSGIRLNGKFIKQ